MPIKGLTWNRSQKDVTLASPDNSRRSHQVDRKTVSSDGSDPSTKDKASSVDNKSQKQPSNDSPNPLLDRKDNENLAPPRSSAAGSRPSSSRLSRFKLRHHSSDTQLATTAKNQNESIPPVPAVPPGM
jgi:hypothetical protein